MYDVLTFFYQAHDFPDPLKVDPRRPDNRYHLYESGLDFPGTIPEVIKVIFRLKNLRRAEGAAGRMAGFTLPTYGTDGPMYLDDAGNLSHWPGSMTLVVSPFKHYICGYINA